MVSLCAFKGTKTIKHDQTYACCRWLCHFFYQKLLKQLLEYRYMPMLFIRYWLMKYLLMCAPATPAGASSADISNHFIRGNQCNVSSNSGKKFKEHFTQVWFLFDALWPLVTLKKRSNEPESNQFIRSVQVASMPNFIKLVWGCKYI